MTCAEALSLIPGYLDGALPEREDCHASVGRHLEGCQACREELDRYVQLSMMMSSTGSMAPPADLGVRIRVAVAQAREAQGFGRSIAGWKDRVELVLKNILEPLALPATGGVLAALVVFAFVYQFFGAGVPLAAATADSPSNLLQPARLEMLAGFEMSGLTETSPVGPAGQHPLLVEATVSASGDAVSYRVISGEVDPSLRRELDQLLLFSRFRPQMSFGRPTSGGRVVLSFSKISVRG
jgi:hypothetical protein